MAEKARRSLREYVSQAWSVVEPSTQFVPGWHIDAICEHLEAMLQGQIRNLLINIPPRFMKSLLACVFFPTWAWIDRPHLRWLCSSYAESLSVRDSVKSRRVIQSPWYQRHWGNRFRLTSDQNAKERFENDKTGYRIATSVGGTATGEGGDFVVTDDPHNVKEVASKTQREEVLMWWDNVMSTRLNDPKTGHKLIIMQRSHYSDLAGHVLEQGGYEHLCLPMEYESDRHCVTKIGWEDPRKNEGELLWGSRYGEAELQVLKKPLGTYGYAGQMQQSPVPAGGGLFKQKDFLYFKNQQDGAYLLYRRDGELTSVPKSVCWRFQTCDTATSIKDSADWFVNATWAVTPSNQLLLVNVLRERIEGPDQQGLMRRQHITYRPAFQGVENKTFGLTLIQSMRRSGLPVVPLEADSDKFSRALPIAAKMEAGEVFFLKDADWLQEYESELLNFPAGKHDDQVDVTAYAGIVLAQIENSQMPRTQLNESASEVTVGVQISEY